MRKLGGFSRLFRGAVLAVVPISCIGGFVACSSSSSSEVGNPDAASPGVSCGTTDVAFDAALATEDADCNPTGYCALVPLPEDGGYLSGTDCFPYCGSSERTCRLVDAAVAECTLGCIGGRRPEGYASRQEANDARAFFETLASLEAASIPAFERLARELEAHGASRDLVSAARRARGDEIRHVKIVSDLARRFGGAAQTTRFELGPVRDLEAIAMENAIEGCVRETMGALIAAWQAERAGDESVREAMKKIADDEARHAELAHTVAAWIDEKLDADQRARVETAKKKAIAELFESWSDPSNELRAIIGLPTRSEARTLFEHVAPSLGLAA
ncbi:MAG: hypothetical protein ACRELY_31120 [Polyangiaceae bacterium]